MKNTGTSGRRAFELRTIAQVAADDFGALQLPKRGLALRWIARQHAHTLPAIEKQARDMPAHKPGCARD